MEVIRPSAKGGEGAMQSRQADARARACVCVCCGRTFFRREAATQHLLDAHALANEALSVLVGLQHELQRRRVCLRNLREGGEEKEGGGGGRKQKTVTHTWRVTARNSFQLHHTHTHTHTHTHARTHTHTHALAAPSPFSLLPSPSARRTSCSM